MACGGGDLPNGHRDDEEDETNNIPDDEKPEDLKKVEFETKVVVTDFLYRRLKSRTGFEDSDMSVANFPPMNDLDDLMEDNEQKINEAEKEKYELIGKQLAQFGDVIENKYRDTFVRLISDLNIPYDIDFGFDKFCLVAERLFNNGITWGRIVSLLCFGYEIAVTVIKRGAPQIRLFLQKIVAWVVKFIAMNNRIVQWIVTQGGWVSNHLF